MAKVILDESNFKDEVANGVVLVDFFATWCGPCKMIAPVLDELAVEYEGKMKIGKLDVDQVPHIAGQYGVQSIPTLVIFKDGQEIDRIIGFQGKEALKSRIDRALGE